MNKLFKPNMDDALRQNIMGIKAAYELGGTESFSGMTLDTLDRLIQEGFVDPEGSQNASPASLQFRDFMDSFRAEGVTAHGYIVSPARDDYRLTIEGLEARSPNREFRAAFALAFADADELDCDMEHDTAGQRCWYD